MKRPDESIAVGRPQAQSEIAPEAIDGLIANDAFMNGVVAALDLAAQIYARREAEKAAEQKEVKKNANDMRIAA